MTVSFQGIAGAFGEEATVALYGESTERLPCSLFEDVFQAVATDTTQFGVVPIENALAGSILENYDLLLEHSLQIVHEVSLPVSHCLLAKPGVLLTDITHCYSHPQALSQCRRFLIDHGIEPRPAHNTAAAAQSLSLGDEDGAAAIASLRAGELYGLNVVASNIQHRDDNRTRFIAIAKVLPASTTPTKASIVFTTANKPGALLACLKVFLDAGFNLTKLESRPTGETLWEYYFYVDFELGADTEVSEAAVSTLVENLSDSTEFVRVLGRYSRVSAHARDVCALRD